MRILLLFYNPNLQIITLQCVWGYKQKTPRMWGYNVMMIFILQSVWRFIDEFAGKDIDINMTL